MKTTKLLAFLLVLHVCVCESCRDVNGTSNKLQGIMRAALQEWQEVLPEILRTTLLISDANENGTSINLPDLIKSSISEALGQNQEVRENITNVQTIENVSECPFGWNRLSSTCAWASPKDKKLNFNDAILYCKRMTTNNQRPRLAEPRNSVQNEELRHLINVLDAEDYNGYILIGVHDQINEGQFVYASSEQPISYDNWRHDQPNDGTNGN